MKKWYYASAYIVSILISNLLVIQYGIINLGWIQFPAGAAVIGLTFSLRDYAQREWGDKKVWYFMIVSTIITGLLNWEIALASVAAFLVAEAVDWLIYTYYSKSFVKRVILSNLISTPIDSLVFVVLAFGFFGPAVYGQSVVKYLSSLIVVPFILYARSRQSENQISIENQPVIEMAR